MLRKKIVRVLKNVIFVHSVTNVVHYGKYLSLRHEFVSTIASESFHRNAIVSKKTLVARHERLIMMATIKNGPKNISNNLFRILTCIYKSRTKITSKETVIVFFAY